MRHGSVSDAHANENANGTASIHALEVASLILIGNDEIEFAYYVAEMSNAPNVRAGLYGVGCLGVLMAETTMRLQSDNLEYPGGVRYLRWRDVRELSLTGVGGFVRGMDGRGVADKPQRATLAVTFAESGEVVELPAGPPSDTSLQLTFDQLLQVITWIRAADANEAHAN